MYLPKHPASQPAHPPAQIGICVSTHLLSTHAAFYPSVYCLPLFSFCLSLFRVCFSDCLVCLCGSLANFLRSQLHHFIGTSCIDSEILFLWQQGLAFNSVWSICKWVMYLQQMSRHSLKPLLEISRSQGIEC